MMSSDRIEDIHSYKKIKRDIKGAKALATFAEFGSKIGLVDGEGLMKELAQLNELEEQIIEISKLPDEFNDLFSEKGWIAYESMNTTVMKVAIQLMKQGEEEKAENELLAYYTGERIKLKMIRLRNIPEFMKRHHLLQVAHEEYVNKKYITCIPLLLMIIDGAVNDIDKNKGFFTTNVDLHAWDSIAAHQNGLTKLRDIFNRGRKSTTTDEIYLPYRNGILHGRDLNYGNQKVAAKAWALMFAIQDWKIALNKGKKNPIPKEPVKSFKENWDELVQTIDSYEKNRKEREEQSQKVSKWKPREFEIEDIHKMSGDLSDCDENTPELKVLEFLQYWKKKNYGKIAMSIRKGMLNDKSISELAGEYRSKLSGYELIDYELVEIKDESPVISEVFVNTKYKVDDSEKEKKLKFRLIYEDGQGNIYMRGSKEGQWMLFDEFIYEIF